MQRWPWRRSALWRPSGAAIDRLPADRLWGLVNTAMLRVAMPAFQAHEHVLLADASGGRLRRPVDGLAVFAAAGLFAAASVLASVSKADEQEIVSAADTLFGWFDPGWRIAYAALLGFAVLVVGAAVLRRRVRLVRDLVVAWAAVFVVGFPVGRVVRSEWPDLTQRIWTASDQYPGLRLAAAIAVLAVAGPELTRSARIVAAWLALLGSAGAIVLGIAYPSAVLGAFTLGFVVAGLVRLAFGSTAGFPTADRVIAGVQELGIPVRDLVVSARQRPGAATYDAIDDGGVHLAVVVLGHDAQDTQRLATMWRNLAFRDSGPNRAAGRLPQVEHESVITLLAERAGVPVPRVRVAGLVESGDALLVTEQPAAPEAEQNGAALSDEFLAGLWRSAAALRSAGLAHGALNLSNVLVTDNGPMIVRFNRGQLAAPGAALEMDLAELMVATSVATDPQRALTAALATVGPDAVASTLPFLQRAALTPHLRDLARSHELKLTELRRQAAAATHVDVPEIAPMRRIRRRDVLLTVLVGIAAYVLITQLAKIGFGTVADQLRDADWQWALIALLTAQLTFVSGGVTLRSTVLTPLPLLPCVVLQSALKFVGLTVPGHAGKIAVNLRFLQRLGVPTGQAVAASAVDGISDTIIQLVLIPILLPFVHLQSDLPAARGGGSVTRLGLVLIGVVLLAVVVMVAVPKLRAKVAPTARDGMRSLVAVARTRSKRVQLFGGNIASQLLYALALGAAAQAYGVDLTLAEMLLVNMGASVFARLVPVPGGVGVAEAGITAGLVAVGVDQTTAFAIALTYRLCTNYLPPIWGFFSLQWLNRKAYL